MDMNAPAELLNLDVMHKRSTARNVETMSHGRFSTAPRGEHCAAMSHEPFVPCAPLPIVT